ncbi:MAG: hypothetical protein ACXACY_13330 [Candidatus Hodarchaeales archaeon]|jgi:hypothetical protein
MFAHNSLERIRALDSFLNDPNTTYSSVTEEMLEDYTNLKKRCVKVNGEWYTVRYIHFIDDIGGISKFDKHIEQAFTSSQIKRYKGKIVLSDTYPIRTLAFASGYTICTLETDGRKPVATGYAFCSPKDQFNRKIGRSIAFNRAVGQLRKESHDSKSEKVG